MSIWTYAFYVSVDGTDVSTLQGESFNLNVQADILRGDKNVVLTSFTAETSILVQLWPAYMVYYTPTDLLNGNVINYNTYYYAGPGDLPGYSFEWQGTSTGWEKLSGGPGGQETDVLNGYTSQQNLGLFTQWYDSSDDIYLTPATANAVNSGDSVDYIATFYVTIWFGSQVLAEIFGSVPPSPQSIYFETTATESIPTYTYTIADGWTAPPGALLKKAAASSSGGSSSAGHLSHFAGRIQGASPSSWVPHPLAVIHDPENLTAAFQYLLTLAAPSTPQYILRQLKRKFFPKIPFELSLAPSIVTYVAYQVTFYGTDPGESFLSWVGTWIDGSTYVGTKGVRANVGTDVQVSSVIPIQSAQVAAHNALVRIQQGLKHK